MNQFEGSAMEKALFVDTFDMYKSLSTAATKLQDFGVSRLKKLGTFPRSRGIIRFNHTIILLFWALICDQK